MPKRIIYVPNIDDFSTDEVLYSHESEDGSDPEVQRRDYFMSRLREFMEQLTQAQREVLELRLQTAKSFSRIGAILGKDAETVRGHYHRAVKKLKKIAEMQHL